MDKYICKVCKIEKIRISNKYGQGGTNRWLDDKGKKWSGKTCPDCFRDYNAIKIAERRRDTR